MTFLSSADIGRFAATAAFAIFELLIVAGRRLVTFLPPPNLGGYG